MPNLPGAFALDLSIDKRHWRCYKHFTIYMGNLAYLHYSNSLRGIWKLYQDWYHSLNGNMDKVFPPFDSPSLCSLSYILGFVRNTCQHLKGKSAVPSRLSSPEIFQGSFQWKEWKKWIHMEETHQFGSINVFPYPYLRYCSQNFRIFVGFFEVWTFQVWSSGFYPRMKLLGATLSQPSSGASDATKMSHQKPNDFSRWNQILLDFLGKSTQHLMTFCETFRKHFFQLGIPQSTINHRGFHGTKRILRFIHQNATFESNGSVNNSISTESPRKSTESPVSTPGGWFDSSLRWQRSLHRPQTFSYLPWPRTC